MIGNIKVKDLIKWTDVANDAFEKAKQDFTDATLLNHSTPGVFLALVCDASDFGARVALQQKINGSWKSLAFFLRKFSSEESRYNAFDQLFLLFSHQTLSLYGGGRCFHDFYRSQTTNFCLPTEI